MLFDSVQSSLRNLGRKRFRSILTISSIAIGVCSVVLIGSIGEIGKTAVSQELNALGLGSLTVSADRRFTSLQMSEQDLALLRDLPQVESATPVLLDYGNIRMRGLVANAVSWGVDAGSNQVISLTPQHGRLINQADLAGAADICVVDMNVAQLFYKRDNIVGKKLQVMLGGSYVELEIVGVASSGGSLMQNMMGEVIPSFIYLPYTTLQRYKGERSFEQIAITLDHDQRADVAAEQISAQINRAHNLSHGFKVENIAKQKDSLDQMLGIVTMILSAIAAISLVVAGLGIMTVMIVSVNERTREIGIKKSIGATGSIILSEFLVEAFILSFIGGAIGLIVGLWLVWGGCLLTGLPFVPDPGQLGLSVGLSVGVGVLFGVYPAILAARLRPVDALRTE